MEVGKTQRIYYLIIFLSLVGLVFYLGYLYGTRELVASKPDNITINNPNGQATNSITKIQQRQIYGSTDSENVTTFGQIYFVENDKNQTEILIDLQNVPAKIKQTKGLKEVEIPNTLQVQVATRVRDSDGKENYNYQNISKNPSNPAIITLTANASGTRSGRFSGNIDSLIFDPQTLVNKVERLVLQPTDSNLQNIFIDRNSDLPIKVRGNPEANVAGQSAPFFWVKF
jgi:hypothetical protein